MSSLTEEQKRRMEENRLKAMQKLASRRTNQTPPQPQPQPRPVGQQPGTSMLAKQVQSALSKAPVQNGASKSFPPYKSAPNNFQRTSSGSFSSPSNNSVKATPSQSPKSFYGDIKKGVLALISKDRFELVMDYHEPTIDAIKKVDGRLYDANKRTWNFPITQYDKLLSLIKSLQPQVVVGELPKIVLNTFRSKVTGVKPSDVDLSPIQPSMLSTLMEFQKDSVRFAVSKGGRVLIADDMGLGKTIQALAIADYYRKNWPLLIVCPSSMRFQWQQEIQKHLPEVKIHYVFVMTTGKEPIDRSAQVLITSYDLMTSQKDVLLQKNFGCVIMDESHHLKNPKTQRTKVGLELLKRCHRCVLLSGTPVLSRPQELFSQLHGVKPSVFNNFMEFGIRYCEGKKGKFGWDFNGSSNMTELAILMSELLMVRRLKSDVLSQLPPKRREVVVLESGTKKNLSDTSEFAKILEKDGLKGVEKRSTLLQYFHETGLSKIKGVSNYIQDMLENGEKFLVFAHHAQVLDALCEAVEAKKKDYIRIDGSVSSEARKKMADHFQNEESCLVAVLSIRAANTGLTLTAAKLVIFAELYWNPGELCQAEDRAHRIGQEDSVLVQYLIQNGTADDHLWPLIQKKLNVLNKAGLSKDDFREADTHVLKDKNQRDVLDYFNSADAELAGVNLEEFDDDFDCDPVPEKRQRTQ